MFSESMLNTSWGQHTRRSGATVTSFMLQLAVIGVLVTVPLLNSVGVPLARIVSAPITVGRYSPRSETPLRPHAGTISVVPYGGRLMLPTRIPTTIASGNDGPTQIESGSGSDGIGNDGLDFGPPTTGIPLPIGGTRPVMPSPIAPAVRPFRTSSILQGHLIRRVEPVYPSLAKAAHIQGPVVLEAIINRDGAMQNLQLISGHPMLVQAAVAAVSQWRYRPYVLNGEAIEVETQITVNFVLSGN